MLNRENERGADQRDDPERHPSVDDGRIGPFHQGDAVVGGAGRQNLLGDFVGDARDFIRNGKRAGRADQQIKEHPQLADERDQRQNHQQRDRKRYETAARQRQKEGKDDRNDRYRVKQRDVPFAGTGDHMQTTEQHRHQEGRVRVGVLEDGRQPKPLVRQHDGVRVVGVAEQVQKSVKHDGVAGQQYRVRERPQPDRVAGQIDAQDEKGRVHDLQQHHVDGAETGRRAKRRQRVCKRNEPDEHGQQIGLIFQLPSRKKIDGDKSQYDVAPDESRQDRPFKRVHFEHFVDVAVEQRGLKQSEKQKNDDKSDAQPINDRMVVQFLVRSGSYVFFFGFPVVFFRYCGHFRKVSLFFECSTVLT